MLIYIRRGLQFRARESRVMPSYQLENQGFDPTGLLARATEIVAFLKALSHDGRLAILCYLLSGPKSVSELEVLLSSRQAAVSQQLARLRLEGLVTARRDGKTMSYSILDPKVQDLLRLLDSLSRRSDHTGA
jgi:DNA-binding transcriptional ArsR family regulator